MAIQVLDQQTIDKIAAGEVIERPASVVKELVENSIDAGATAVTVEVKEGGTTFIRITDNGCGIEKREVPLAFLRHSTSKIRSVEDLFGIRSLGFRGEALSSIAAVAQVELITKPVDQPYGVRYVIEGGREKQAEDVGAPDGTTFLVRNLFYNTPARQKFLKSPMTEAGYINDLMVKLALSHPELSLKFINNGQVRLHTSGNSNLRDIIYQVYGREIAAELIHVERESEEISIRGYIGKPVISRGNRNFENYYINGRYIKSTIIAKALEDAYKTFMMQHKFPFAVLHITIDGNELDVNVHPTKMELRFSNQEEIYQMLYETVRDGLSMRELIPEVTLPDGRKAAETKAPDIAPYQPNREAAARPARFTDGHGGSGGKSQKQSADHIQEGRIQPDQRGGSQTSGVGKYMGGTPETDQSGPFRQITQQSEPEKFSAPGNSSASEKEVDAGKSLQEKNLDYFLQEMKKRVTANHEAEREAKNLFEQIRPLSPGEKGNMSPGEGAIPLPEGGSETMSDHFAGLEAQDAARAVHSVRTGDTSNDEGENGTSASLIQEETSYGTGPKGQAEQLELFEQKLLDENSRHRQRIIGQLFDTYWLVEFDDHLYIIDQHAAHEKVLYERTMKSLKTREYTSQMVSPPIILTLSMQEGELLKEYLPYFKEIGFEIEPFGGNEYSVGAVPDNLFGIAQKELLLELIDSLSEFTSLEKADIISEKIASMSCKAAVKGNMAMSPAEAEALIGELLTLDNPYNCPHGRPTIISMSKYELEKKFKRIV